MWFEKKKSKLCLELVHTQIEDKTSTHVAMIYSPDGAQRRTPDSFRVPQEDSSKAAHTYTNRSRETQKCKNSGMARPQ